MILDIVYGPDTIYIRINCWLLLNTNSTLQITSSTPTNPTPSSYNPQTLGLVFAWIAVHTTWRAWPFVAVVRLFRPPDRGFGVAPRDWQTVTHPFQQRRTQPDGEKKHSYPAS